jgi:hypothetical protein
LTAAAGLITEPLFEFLLGRSEFRERVKEAADYQRRDVLDDFDQSRPVEHEVHRAAYPRVVERFSLIIEPRRVDHALVIGGGRHPRRRFGLAQCPRIGDAHIIHPA